MIWSAMAMVAAGVAMYRAMMLMFLGDEEDVEPRGGLLIRDPCHRLGIRSRPA